MQSVSLPVWVVASQTYPRKQDFRLLNVLADTGASLHKMTFDLRLLQSPVFGEWAEPFGEKQVGSSAMPFKRNPINAENVGSLSRLVATLPKIGWDNAALTLLERTLDDSANRREAIPVAFLAVDEMLRRATKIIDGLVVNEEAVARNLETFGIFAATEKVLMEAVKNGGDRQELHEVIRQHCMSAWGLMGQGKNNILDVLIKGEPQIMSHVDYAKIDELLDATRHVGFAPGRARGMAKKIQVTVSRPADASLP